MKCPSCEQEIASNWKYCRFCGSKLEYTTPAARVNVDTEKVSLEDDSEFESALPKKQVEFDKDLYMKILTSRSERKEIVKQKSELIEEIDSLLEQLKSGIVSREYIAPKIKKLKEEVRQLNERESKFGNLPDVLPVEVLVDELDSARERYHKLSQMKNDKSVSKQTLTEAKKQYLDNIKLLEDQKSTVDGYLRSWQKELHDQLEESRRQIELLYIKSQTGEIIDEVYEKRKADARDNISKIEKIIALIEQILQN